MIKRAVKYTYLYYDEHLQLREVKRFKLKVFGFVCTLVTFVMFVIYCFNMLSQNFLGLENDRVTKLEKENRFLHEQLTSMTNHVHSLESSLDTLSTQGNVLRLMVDLSPLDKDVQAGGTGGSTADPVLSTFPDGSSEELLHSVSSTIQLLQSEANIQRQSYEQILKKSDYDKGYFSALPALQPMEGYYSAGEFGLRMHPVLGIFKTHDGLDIANDVGTPVIAAAEGVVAVAGASGGGYGTVVVLNHGYGYQTLYAHLSKTLVHVGRHVKRGDVIAKSGRTGLVTGPHLHYEVRYNGVCQNPVNYFFDNVNPMHHPVSLTVR